MNTPEDFENAPAGSTATAPDGERAIRSEDEDHPWWTSFGAYNDHYEMAYYSFTLDPPTPSLTPKEHLECAWGLAHPVKKGQSIPVGTEFVQVSSDGTYMHTYVSATDYVASEWDETHMRTLEPLPEPSAPEWTNAPAVIAKPKDDDWFSVWEPCYLHVYDETLWKSTRDMACRHWSDLRNIIPLYTKEGEKWPL